MISDRYNAYLDRFVPAKASRFDLQWSVQECYFKDHPGASFEVTLVGDGTQTGRNALYVRLDDGVTIWLDPWNVTVISGSLRKVPRRGRIIMGRSSLMGAVAHGIRSGRAFRGRG